MLKKVLAITVCIAMLLSLVTIVHAEGITWEYNDATKVLTIKGSGKMTSAPWNDAIDVTKVEKIVIENGITSICDNAFCVFTEDDMIPYSNLTKVTIPESVTAIGERAFGMAEKLVDVKLPSKLKKLGMVAFMGTAIEEVTVPATLTEWHKTTFANCANLENVTISKGVTKVPDFAFYNNTSLTEITIPDSVVTMGEYVFAGCSELVSVNLPRSVVTIGVYAFDECTNLKEISIPENVKMLNYSLDNWCLEKVNFSGTRAQWEKIEGNAIGENTELVCRNEILNYTVSENENYTVLSWNDYPNASGYDLSIYKYNPKEGFYDFVETYPYEAASTFVMEDNGYEDGLYCADLWVYVTWTEGMDFSDMMWKESVYFAVGESKGQDTYALTGVKMKELSDGRFFVEAEIIERANRNKSDMFVIAVYQDEVMIDMAYMTANLITGIPFSFGGILEGGEGVELRAFAWENMDNMKPLSNIVSGRMSEFDWN